jgi:CheY-like chemotaxis protein
LRVLVVDDHPVNRQLMQAVLERLGHRCQLCENGAEALAWLQTQACDLVMMDLHMPVMDGFAATRAIRALPPPAGDLPIVAVTADVLDTARQRALDAGMNDFLAKPVQFAVVEELLRRYSPRGKDQAPGAEPDGGSAASSEPSTAAQRGHAAQAGEPPVVAAKPARLRFRRGEVAQWLDLEAIAEICLAIGLAGYRSLLGGLLANGSDALTELLQSLDPGADPAGVRAAAHRFKGAAASLGLRRLAATAAQWEQAAAEAALDAEQRARAMQQVSDDFHRSRALCQRIGYLDD